MELNRSRADLRAPVEQAIVVAGAASLLAQVVLLREILASSQGNELVLGFVLAGWLGLTGLASAFGAKLAGDPAHAALRLGRLLCAAPLLLLASLWLLTFARPGALGQAPSVPVLFSVSLLALAPACAVGGLSFAWAAASMGEQKQATVIYVAETLGAALAGLLFHFWLADRLPGVWIVFVASTSCIGGGAFLAWPRWRSIAVAVGAAVVALSALLCPGLHAALVDARFPGERVLLAQPSRYGLLAVVAQGGQRAFFHDGVLLFTSEDEAAAEEDAHLSLLLHPRPQRVLMIGGGLGGRLVQVMKHHPQSVDYVEMDPGLVPLARRFADDATKAALADARVHSIGGDGRALLREAAGRYDLVLVDLPVAQNAIVARFSTRECFEDARRALAPDGILVLVTPGSDAYLDSAARLRHASLLATLAPVFPAVGVAPGERTVLWASRGPIDASSSLLARRLDERDLGPLRIGRAWLFDRLLPMHAQGYRRSLERTLAVENRDFRPVVYLFGLVENLLRVSPRLGGAALAFVSVRWAAWPVAGVVVGLVGVVLLARRGRRAPGFAAAVVGAAGMALELVLLLAFQAMRGHLYHAVGGMLAGFMAGMSLGALAGRRLGGQPRALAYACGAMAGVVGLVPAVLVVARAVPWLGGGLLFIWIVVVGASSGAVYPLAVEAAGHERAGAHVYAWDLAGAAGAALVTSLLAVPLLGLMPVAALSAVLCAGAAVANLRRG